MAGCYGSHPEDRAREEELHRYLERQHCESEEDLDLEPEQELPEEEE